MYSESAVRRAAAKAGYRVIKSRQQLHLNNLGEFMLVDSHSNAVVRGANFDASLDDIREFLGGSKTKAAA
jgi:hypothetical protein